MQKWFLVAGLIAACGTKNSASTTGGTTGGNTSIVTSPASNGVLPLPHVPITVTYPKALDPASTATATTTLRIQSRGAPRAIVGQIALSADNKVVTFTPSSPLTRGTEHRLRLEGLKFADGTDAESLDLPFTVRAVATRKIITSTAGVADGSGVTTYTTTDGTTRARTLSYRQPGGNGVFGDDDDVLTGWREWVTSATEERSATYNGAGPDGVWLNADDKARDGTTTTFDAQGNVVKTDYLSAGPDALMFGADDIISAAMSRAKVSATEWHTTYESNGSDGIANNGDDGPTDCSVESFDVLGNDLSYVNWRTGGNGICFDSDDERESEQAFTYASSGRLTAYAFQFGGDDGFFGNEDDVIGHSTYTYDTRGYLTQVLNFEGVADELTSYDAITLDADFAATTTSYDAGPDHAVGGGDDVITAVNTETLAPLAP